MQSYHHLILISETFLLDIRSNSTLKSTGDRDYKVKFKCLKNDKISLISVTYV